MKIAFTHNLQRAVGEAEAEFDTPQTVEAIVNALSALGHQVIPVDVGSSAPALVRELEALEPDLIFNTAEGRRGRYREAFYPALFEEMGIPYTGSDAYTCGLTLDKHMTKLVVAEVGVPVPRSILVTDLTNMDVDAITLPVILKPNFEGSSKGITADSIVTRPADLLPRLEKLLASYPEGMLVEQYIPGRDIAVAFIEGVGEDGVLPAAEYTLDMEAAGSREHAIYDYGLKNELSHAVSVRVPARLDDKLAARMRRYARASFRALQIRDMGRIDFRVTDEGELYFIEVNALPSLEPGASIYEASALMGMKTISEVLGTIIGSAARRQGLSESTAAERSGERAVRVGLIYNLKRLAPTLDGDNDDEAEFDAPSTLAAIGEAIGSLQLDGFPALEVVPIEANDRFPGRLQSADIDVAFNIAEGVRGRSREALVPVLLEHFDIPYSGSDATTLALTLDKRLAKQIVAHQGLHTPTSMVMERGDEPLAAGLSFPLILKPVAEGSSKGVTAASVVHDEAQLRELAGHLVERYRQGALVEQFVGGREFTVGVLGSPPRALAPMEVVFDSDDAFPVYTFAHKQGAEDGGFHYEAPAKVDEALGEALAAAALGAFKALGCRDVARIDLRLDAAGHVHFIECNPLPGLTPGWSDLCLIAQAEGLTYAELIGQILTPALQRWRKDRPNR